MKKNKLETKFKSSKESLGFLIWKASNKLQRLHRVALKDLDLTPTQFSVLASMVYMSSHHDELTQSLLCQHTQMDKMLISDITKSLVKKKFVRKEKSLTDSRSFLIIPTSSGIEIANKSVKIIEEIDEDFFSSIRNQSLFAENLNQILED